MKTNSPIIEGWEEKFIKVWKVSMVSSRSAIALEGKDVQSLISSLLQQQHEHTLALVEKELDKHKCDFNWDFEKNKAKHKEYIALDDLRQKIKEL